MLETDNALPAPLTVEDAETDLSPKLPPLGGESLGSN